VVPTVNLEQALRASDISLISCAGQATIPVLHSVSQEFPPSYVEIVTTAASVTAGPATRRNLDEFLACTGSAIAAFTGSAEVKVLANISPAKPEPPCRLVMRLQAQGMDPRRVQDLVEEAAQAVRTNVPGYAVTSCSLSRDVATVTAEVTSTGAWIPRYAGNLEIISAAAVAVATTLVAPATVPDPSGVAAPVAEETPR
jgi:acetaldehyde dehydrogenase